MPKSVKKLDSDVVVVGAGPGGCTVAKEMSKRGKKVILIEKGGTRERFINNRLDTLFRVEKEWNVGLLLRKTVEGDSLTLAHGVGGGTHVYLGSAFFPDLDYWKRYNVDIPQELVDEAVKECWVSLPPDEFIGPGTRRIWEAANELGMQWIPLHRHVDFNKCKAGCEECMVICRREAKWTAKVFAMKAVEQGATLLTNLKVREAIIDNGVAVGVRAVGRGGQIYEITAKVIVCSAGGVHTAEILKRFGLEEAGSWFTGDPTSFSFGFVKEGRGNGFEHPMTVGYHDKKNGVLFSAMLMPYVGWHMQFIQDEHLHALRKLFRFRKTLSLFAKVSDEGTGQITPDGKVSKTFTQRDWNRIKYGRETAERILVKTGCDPNDLHHTGLTLTHPSGTVRIGKLVDTNLESPIKNLYCCDTSVIPEAPGLPPVMTIVVLGKRLARHLQTIS
jgi:choline dehydrogenase-like flavoprotein